MNFEEHHGFRSDLKRLSEKHKSLREDLCVLKKILAVLPGERPPFSFQVKEIVPAGRIIKVEKFACKSLKGTGAYAGLMIIYALFDLRKKIVLIGIYEGRQPRYEKRILRRTIS